MNYAIVMGIILVVTGLFSVIYAAIFVRNKGDTKKVIIIGYTVLTFIIILGVCEVIYGINWEASKKQVTEKMIEVTGVADIEVIDKDEGTNYEVVAGEEVYKVRVQEGVIEYMLLQEEVWEK